MGEAWDAAKAHHKAVLFTQLFQRPSFPQVVPNQFLLVLGRHKPLQQLQEVKTQRLQVITAKGESKQKGRYSFVNSQAIFLTAHPDMAKNVYETLNIKSLGKKNRERREEIRKSRRDITKKNVWKASSSLHFFIYPCGLPDVPSVYKVQLHPYILCQYYYINDNANKAASWNWS